MKMTPSLLRLILVFLLPLVTACLGSTPPAQFYLLEPLTETAPVDPNASRPSISLAPIKIPRYLDRSQIVTAIGKNAYQIDELNRWAENLEDNMTRVMLQDLTTLIPADVILTNTKRAKQASVGLKISVLEFHVDAQGQAGLVAQWQVSKGEQVLLNRQNAYHRPSSTTDAKTQVEALNECFNLLAKEIAHAFRTMSADQL